MTSTLSDLVAAHIQLARKRQGVTAQQLAAKCTAIGAHQLSAAVIANIETGRRDTTGKRRRDVTIDELCAFALALGMQPADMLGPHEGFPIAQITSDIQSLPVDITAWMRGSNDSVVPSLLGGIALCGACHVTVLARTTQGEIVYFCANAACPGPRVNMTATGVDEWVSNLITARLMQPEVMDLLLQEDPKRGYYFTAEVDAFDKEIAKLAQRRAETQRKFEELAHYPQLSAEILARSLASFDQRIKQLRKERGRAHRLALLARHKDAAVRIWDTVPLTTLRAIVEEQMSITIVEIPEGADAKECVLYEWR